MISTCTLKYICELIRDKPCCYYNFLLQINNNIIDGCKYCENILKADNTATGIMCIPCWYSNIVK